MATDNQTSDKIFKRISSFLLGSLMVPVEMSISYCRCSPAKAGEQHVVSSIPKHLPTDQSEDRITACGSATVVGNGCKTDIRE
jgi:hypothetical protein